MFAFISHGQSDLLTSLAIISLLTELVSQRGNTKGPMTVHWSEEDEEVKHQ